MRYTVIWLSSLEDELARLYLLARADGNAARMTAATARIDTALASNPSEAGESRDGNVRILFEAPLSIDFQVLASERMVIVTEVRYYRPKT